MALNIYQALTTVEQQGYTYTELDDAVNNLWSRVITTPQNFPTFFFRFGMPGKIVGGKYGFEVIGLSGMHVKPTPNKLDHRVSFRYAPAPNYTQKLGNYFRFVVPVTDYPKERQFNLMKPQHGLTVLMLSAAQSFPLYLKYLSWNMLKGANKQMQDVDPVLHGWVGKFIEPSNGSSEGYKFYLSDGYGEVNLNKVINKTKVTDHALSKKLKEINDELRKDSKKVEYDHTKDPYKIVGKKFIKDSITDPETVKFVGLCFSIREQIDKILEIGRFPDVKYKVKNDENHWDGQLPPINSASELVLVLPSESVRKWNRQKSFIPLGKFNFDVGSDWFGVETVVSNALDENTAYLITRDLIQCWFMPALSFNHVQPYPDEETIDYKHNFGHSLDMVNVHCNMYFCIKSN